MKTFVESQFNYCPLIWMFHFKQINHKINNVHERAIRIVYSDYKSTLQEFLDKDASFSVHQRNIQTLQKEAIKGEVFKINRTLPYNLRIENDFCGIVPKIVKYGTESTSFLAPKVRALVPEKMKECFYLEAFKSKISKWKQDCPWRICKTYLQHVHLFILQ